MRRLAADLRAVIAAWRLKLRELLRRNGEGDLPRPSFWPASLAALFWPLLLAVLLAVLLAAPQAIPLAAGLSSRERAAGDQARSEQLPSERNPIIPGVAGPERGAAAQPLPPSAAVAPSAVDSPPAAVSPSAAVAPSAVVTDESAPGRSPLPDPPAPSELSAPSEPASSPPEPPGPDPLLQALVGPEPPPWVLDLEERPAESLLLLRLGSGFGALDQTERARLCEAWLANARSLGYERLNLRDGDDHLLARPARVGSGMILLDPPVSRR